MPTRTIRRNWDVDGVRTDVTSAKLSDATGAYGVKRDDTNSVVVADNVAMTKVATGVYEYTFTEPAGYYGPYTAWVELVYGGQTYRFEHDLPEVLPASDDTLTAYYSSLCVAIADFLHWGRNSEGEGSDWSTEDQARLSDVINSGYHQFLYPPIVPNEKTAHCWSFLRPAYAFDTVADDWTYDMPSTFGAIVGDMVYDDEGARIIRQVSPGYIDRQRSLSDTRGRPSVFALRPKSVAGTALQVTECVLWPTPDAPYSLLCYYDARVAKLSAASPYALGGQAHAETLLQSCRAIAAQRYRDEAAGKEHDLFLQRLQASIEADRRNSPAFLGYNTAGAHGHCVTRHGSGFRCSLRNNLGGG